MALPNLNSNLVYEVKIPSTGQRIKYRPFLVGEEKLFLIAAQSESARVMYDTIKRVISQCVITEGFSVDGLQSYDLEFLFLQLRAKSVGETEDLAVLCTECKAKNSLTIDFENNVYITNLDVEKKDRVDFGNGIIVSLRTPETDTLLNIVEKNLDEVESIFEVVDILIDKVYTNDEVFDFKQETHEERMKFIHSMSSTQVQSIVEFVSHMPQVAMDISFTCGNCGTVNTRILKGLNDFFTLG